MIARTRTCSWCHHANECPRGELVWCTNCGHRADVPRLLCNCMKCLAPKQHKLYATARERIARAKPN